MPIVVLKLLLFAIAIILALFTGASAFRSSRRLDQRIREFKEEQDRLAVRGGPIDPYAALGEAVASKTERPRGRR